MWLNDSEVAQLKLKSVPVPLLKELAKRADLSPGGTTAALIQELAQVPSQIVDDFIKEKYQLLKVLPRQARISDQELKTQLEQVNARQWGVVQGQLDAKIQREYVRKYPHYQELLAAMDAVLVNDIKSYVTASWFNHWTTELIEDHIALHPRVVPTIKNIADIDFFFGGQPFDLKITSLPKDYSLDDAKLNPRKLAQWLYENQGEQRFGANNRLLIVLVDQANPGPAWTLKRDFDFLFPKLDEFFSNVDVSSADELLFTFNNQQYSALAKILLVTR